MAHEPTRVDILTLEDFRSTLDARLHEAQALLDTVIGSAASHPALGRFADANRVADQHATRHDVQVDRVRRLIAAIHAAQSATDSIIRNYRTAEARNSANSADIASAFDAVPALLTGGDYV